MIRPKKASLKQARVVSSQQFSDHLQRVTITGDELTSLPVDAAGRYFKLFVSEDGKKPGLFSTKRSYTIHSFNQQTNELVFDAVVNRHQGPATNWIKNVKVGETAYIAGPGNKKLDDFTAPGYILIGDITSANAIRAYLNILPSTTPVQVYMMAPSESDANAYQNDGLQALNANQSIQWIVDAKQAQCTEQLLQALTQAADLAKGTKVFMACEAGCLRLAKGYLQQERAIARTDFYASAYWKLGANSDKLAEEKQQAKA